jgi:hypothetical protein
MAHHIAVFAENKPGRIERVTRVLKEAGINIRAITISTSDSFGVIKLLASDPAGACDALEAEGMSVSRKEIVAVLMDDRPGGLHRVLEVLGREGINIDDAYGFVIADKARAVLVIEVEKAPDVEKLLKEQGLATFSDEEIYAL